MKCSGCLSFLLNLDGLLASVGHQPVEHLCIVKRALLGCAKVCFDAGAETVGLFGGHSRDVWCYCLGKGTATGALEGRVDVEGRAMRSHDLAGDPMEVADRDVAAKQIDADDLSKPVAEVRLGPIGERESEYPLVGFEQTEGVRGATCEELSLATAGGRNNKEVRAR